MSHLYGSQSWLPNRANLGYQNPYSHALATDINIRSGDQKNCREIILQLTHHESGSVIGWELPGVRQGGDVEALDNIFAHQVERDSPLVLLFALALITRLTTNECRRCLRRYRLMRWCAKSSAAWSARPGPTSGSSSSAGDCFFFQFARRHIVYSSAKIIGPGRKNGETCEPNRCAC